MTSHPLSRARALTRLLDTAVKVPGTSFRFGLDPVLGIIPGLGDIAGAGLAAYVVMLANRAGAPRSMLLRMVGNVAIDAVGGTLPIIGDLFDASWKANTKNLAMLEELHAEPQRGESVRAERSSALVAIGAILLLLLLAAAGIVMSVIIVRFVADALR